MNQLPIWRLGIVHDGEVNDGGVDKKATDDHLQFRRRQSGSGRHFEDGPSTQTAVDQLVKLVTYWLVTEAVS